MAPPYQLSDWYGGRPTCHTASGATVTTTNNRPNNGFLNDQISTTLEPIHLPPITYELAQSSVSSQVQSYSTWFPVSKSQICNSSLIAEQVHEPNAGETNTIIHKQLSYGRDQRVARTISGISTEWVTLRLNFRLKCYHSIRQDAVNEVYS